MKAAKQKKITKNILKRGRNLKQLLNNDIKKECEKKKVSLNSYQADCRCEF